MYQIICDECGDSMEVSEGMTIESDEIHDITGEYCAECADVVAAGVRETLRDD
jgi:hypothetical protein